MASRSSSWVRKREGGGEGVFFLFFFTHAHTRTHADQWPCWLALSRSLNLFLFTELGAVATAIWAKAAALDLAPYARTAWAPSLATFMRLMGREGRGGGVAQGA